MTAYIHQIKLTKLGFITNKILETINTIFQMKMVL